MNMIEDQQTLHALPKNTIRLIGSCQVITSVYSVVKELVENSLDANASSVEIKLEDFGLEKIEVIDNGSGVKSVDIPYMAKRHFTSKIACSEDLTSLNTYGFRGEALGSLCAVAKVSITTKTASDQLSYVYTIGPEGDIVDKKPSHTGKGTTVLSKNLFYNIPVRKQYYSANQRKKDDVKRIENLLIAYAILKPALRLTLKHGKELVFQKTSLKDMKTALQLMLGRNISNQLLYKEKCVEEIKLKIVAFLPKPGSDVKDMSLASSDKMFVTANGRPVSNPEINKILKNYYSNCHGLESYRHPVCFVSLEVATHLIDVNVDPNKTKVFFQHKLEVQNALEEILVEIYGPLDHVPSWHYTEAGGSKEANKNKECLKNKTPVKPIILYSQWPNQKQSSSDSDEHNTLTKPREEHKRNKEQSVDLPSFSDTFCQKSFEPCSPDASTVEQSKNHENQKDVLDFNLCSSTAQEERLSCSKSNLDTSFPVDKDASLVSMKNVTEISAIVPAEITNSSLTEGPLDFQQVNSGPEDETQICDSIVSDQHQPVLTLQGVDVLLQNDRLSNDTMRSVQIGEKENNLDEIDPDAWSRGNITVDKSVLQPVKLLPPCKVLPPGKRSLSPLNTSLNQPKRKAPKLSLPSNQATLYDVINPLLKKPDSPYRIFHQEKHPILSQEFPNETEAIIEERLRKSWESIDDKERMTYKEKSWQDAKRYEKEKASYSKNSEGLKTSEVKKTTKNKRVLKHRLYCREKTIKVPINGIRNHKEIPLESPTDKPNVIGPAYKSDDVWFFTLKEKLFLVNTWRVSEVSLYKKLKAEHQLPTKSCDTVSLNLRVISQQGIIVLENLAKKESTMGTFFHIKDKRLLYNGFDIKCHFDLAGNFFAELVGMCSVVPAYDLKDLNKVLDVLSSNPQAELSETRTLKTAYFLQGETVRMLRQTNAKKTRTDVERLLPCELAKTDQTCLHHKPIYRQIIDFAKSDT